MTPPMYRRVRDFFIDSGLTDTFKVQQLMWTDTGSLSDRFIVFRPNGGTNIRDDLGAFHYILVDVISAKGQSEFTIADDRVNAIIDFVKNNPMPNNCIGYIENVGGIPAPVQTTEGRIVFRLQFAITYGE